MQGHRREFEAGVTAPGAVLRCRRGRAAGLTRLWLTASGPPPGVRFRSVPPVWCLIGRGFWAGLFTLSLQRRARDAVAPTTSARQGTESAGR